MFHIGSFCQSTLHVSHTTLCGSWLKLPFLRALQVVKYCSWQAQERALAEKQRITDRHRRFAPRPPIIHNGARRTRGRKGKIERERWAEKRETNAANIPLQASCKEKDQLHCYRYRYHYHTIQGASTIDDTVSQDDDSSTVAYRESNQNVSTQSSFQQYRSITTNAQQP